MKIIPSDDDFGRALEVAAKTRPDVLAACGGDGTINAAAQVAMKRKTPLLVLPGGTLNHFARDVMLDSVSDAIDATRGGAVTHVDVASIDGNMFLNAASFGAYAQLVDERERLEPRIGKWPAAVLALAHVLRKSRPVDVEVGGRRRRLWAIFIGNCQHDPDGFAPRSRASMADGQLDIRMLLADRRWSRLRLLASSLTGGLSRTPLYEAWSTDHAEIRSIHGPLRLAVDGETIDGSRAFTVEKLPRSLAVLVPKRTPQGANEQKRGRR